MKKLLTIIAALAMATSAFSQMTFGAKAGLNIANMKLDTEMGSVSPDSKMGFNLGVYGDYNFTDMFALEAGLTFSNEGCKLKDVSKSSINYLDIPINLRVNFNIGSMQLYGLVGPTIGVALFGKDKAIGEKKDECEAWGEPTEYDLEFGSGDDCDFTRTNIALTLGAGLKFTENLGARLSYDFGLSNIDPAGNSDFKVKNNVFAIALTFDF